MNGKALATDFKLQMPEPVFMLTLTIHASMNPQSDSQQQHVLEEKIATQVKLRDKWRREEV